MARSADVCMEKAIEQCDGAYNWLCEAMDKCNRDYVDALDGAMSLLRKARRAMADVLDLSVMSQQ